MTKIIFLDIDGVLALSGDPMKKAAIGPSLSISYEWNEEACNTLQDILTTCDAEVVLSSDWRKYYSLQEMRQIFFHHGLSSKRLIGYTSINPKYRYSTTSREAGLHRSNEIADWLGLHKPKKWVAIDDLPLVGLDQSHFAHCIDTGKGILLEGLVDKIKGILNE